MSISAWAPASAAATPKAISPTGARWWTTSGFWRSSFRASAGRMPPASLVAVSSSRYPRCERPSSPLAATTSPTRAPERRTGVLPCISPSTVTDRVNTLEVERSPPRTPASGAMSDNPCATPRASPTKSCTGVSGGAATARMTPTGTAPIAAISARLLVMALCPIWSGLDQSRRKSGPSIIMSQLVTSSVVSNSRTAESSPGPTVSLAEPGKRGRIRARVSRSPSRCRVSASESATPPR